MIATAFEYVAAGSVDEATRLLAEHGDAAKLLAGGHSLIPMMKLRLAEPATLIDIGGIAALRGIRYRDGRFEIGALTTHAELAASDELRSFAPALWDAANALGDAQVRNRGTLGGACAHADPAADEPAALVALDATFALAGRGGSREVRAEEFFHGALSTALGPDDVLTSIAFAAAPHSAYVKYKHPASHYAVVGAAVALTLNGAVERARVVLTGLGDGPHRASGVEAALRGVAAGEIAARAAQLAAGAASGADVRSDPFASAEYRAAMAEVYVARAIGAAAAR